ncbi:MAG: hypothetical protein ACRD2E_13075 [Terriglobales bacterium]
MTGAKTIALALGLALPLFTAACGHGQHPRASAAAAAPLVPGPVTAHAAVAHDTSAPLATLIAQAPPPLSRKAMLARRAKFIAAFRARYAAKHHGEMPHWPPPPPPPVAPPPVSAAAAAVEQTEPGPRPSARLAASFAGLGVGFRGPRGSARVRNPSDNSLAVGPRDIIQTVNTQLAIFTKKGRVLYGPVPTKALFAGFPGPCGATGFGDVVVRYDQLADRWVFVLPIFRKIKLPTPAPYGICMAVSASGNPLGRYYRYQFPRALFPDYPRLGVWPSGYYLGTSSGDTVIQKHACVVDRAAMLQGAPASEQCAIINGSNFLNPADIEGYQTPPAGEPEVFLAAGGTQLRKIFHGDTIHYYRFYANWTNPTLSRVTGPFKVAVAPYHYLCNGQLTSCVPQPGAQRRLDAQGDKLMQPVVYRRFGKRQVVLAAQSVNTVGGGGGVRWYEFQLAGGGKLRLMQQSTYAPGGGFRWMPSIGMDRAGDIAVGYSYGGAKHFAGQRIAARLANSPKDQLTLKETILAPGHAAQTDTLRWEDYATMDVAPNGCTFWYVGDYLRAGAKNYSTRIGAIQLPGCRPRGAQVMAARGK